MMEEEYHYNVLVNDETSDDDDISDEDHEKSDDENYDLPSSLESEEDDDDIYQPSTNQAQAGKRRRIESKQKPALVSTLKRQGDSKIKWNLEPVVRNRPSQSKSSLHLPDVIGKARKAKAPLAMWEFLFDKDIFSIIVLHTNEEIARARDKIENILSYHSETDIVEVKALIGLLYIAGYKQQSKVNVEELWGEEFTVSMFKATMSAKRFKFLLRCLRFDDKKNRAERRRSDRFSLIREIWDKFITNCGKYYKPYEICTIDKQLMGFKGKCIFKTYLPRKSERYGIKFMMLNDSKTSYMINAMPYLGKITRNESNEPIANYFVRQLVVPIRNSNRTIVMDDWFTSINLFRILLDEYKLKALGTIRKNSKEIPHDFVEKVPPSTAKYAFTDDITLLLYALNRKETILVLSNTGVTSEVGQKSQKPKLIVEYNQYKGATAAFDHYCKSYTVIRRTNRWPLKVFYKMLDIANVNSTILYNLSHVKEKKNRLVFMKELSFELIKPLLIRRYAVPTLRTEIKKVIAHLLNYETPNVSYSDVKIIPRTRCKYCHYTLNVKTRMMCPHCEKPMCKRHRCPKCVECCRDKSV